MPHFRVFNLPCNSPQAAAQRIALWAKVWVLKISSTLLADGSYPSDRSELPAMVAATGANAPQLQAAAVAATVMTLPSFMRPSHTEFAA
jgi:hypothetical protein